MSYFSKKVQSAITSFAFLVSPLAGYAEGPIASPCEQDCCTTEPCCTESCGNLFVSADLLYWRASVNGLTSVCDNATITETEENGLIISRLKGKAKDPHFNWNPGYRIGLGYAPECRQWFLGAYWTHFNSNSHRNGGRHRKLHWKIDFDVIDVLAGYKFNLAPCFDLWLFGGLRGAMIDQRLKTNFHDSRSSDSIFSLESSSSTFASHSRAKEKFRGIGPLVGVEGEWGIGCNFSLYADASVGFLFGSFHVRSRNQEVFETGINFNHTTRSSQSCQTVVDAGVGIRWYKCFCDRLFLLQLGLEHHCYYNQNQFCGYGDLSFDGANLTLGFGY